MMDSKERGAIWGALAIVVAALIGGVFTYVSRSDKTSKDAPAASPAQRTSPQRPASNSPAGSPAKVYSKEAEVAEGKSYTDDETGFVFAVDEISSFLGTRGVLCRYTLPDGTRESMWRRPVGHRFDFDYQGRKFFLVIEDVDYDRKVAKIRIREIPQ